MGLEVLVDGRIRMVVVDDDERDLVDTGDLVCGLILSVEPLSVRSTSGIFCPYRICLCGEVEIPCDVLIS